MVTTFKKSIRAAFILVTVISAKPLFSQESEKVSEDIYLVDSTVQVLTRVPGDAVVAGGNVSVTSSVTGDVLAAGGTVNITADVGDDIRAAGGSLAVSGDVGDDVVAAGGTVVLDSSSTVAGRAWLAGGSVTVAGDVNGTLRAAGEKIILSGTIGGDVELHAASIEINSDAVLNGNLSYSAPIEAKIHDGAVIAGEITHKEIELEGFDDDGAGFFGSLLFYLSLAASSIALFLLFPRLSISLAKEVQGTPFKSSGIGLIALFSTPFIALMLLVSVIGVPIGLIVLASYFVAIVIGLLIGVMCVGDIAFNRLGKDPDESKRSRAWSILVGATALFVISWIPFIGGWIFFIVMLLGVGGLIKYFYDWYTSRSAHSPASATE